MAATQTRTEYSPRLDCGDACYLKSNPSMLGHVLKTAYDIDESNHLAEFSIYRYTELPEDDLKRFMATGMPPKGYVFFEFSEPSQGSSLIHEDDLKLVNRRLYLGDPVKRHLNDTMSGNVIDTMTNYTLEPIAFRPVDPVTGDYLPLTFTDKDSSSLSGSSTLETPKVSPCLLYNVPQSELKRHEEYEEGDYIVYRQKLGVVQEVERDVILLLPDSSVVSPLDASALEFPLSARHGAAISLPKETNYYEWGNGQYMWTQDLEEVLPGQLTVTKTSNIARGDLPFENQGPVVQARVLATVAESVHINWLCPNVFFPGEQGRGPNCEIVRVSALQGQSVLCDFERSTSLGSTEVAPGSSYSFEEMVRFRDPAGAVKYPGYQHIPANETFGHDMNVFRVVSARTDATVQWHDGSCTIEPTTSLHMFFIDEDELWPGKIVALKDGIKSVDRPSTSSGLVPHLLRGRKRETLRVPQVGIIQTVDSRERIASVRWYESSDVELIYGGNAMNPQSSLGQLSDNITNVSVYELATFSALRRYVGDTILIAPGTVAQSILSPPPSHQISKVAGPCHMDLVSPGTFRDMTDYLQAMKSEMIASAWFQNTTEICAPAVRRRYSVRSSDTIPPVDFFGTIVKIDTSGNITVRLPGTRECRDVQVPFERILMVVWLGDMLTTTPNSSINLGILSADKYSTEDNIWDFQTDTHENGETLEADSINDGVFSDDKSDNSSCPGKLVGAPEEAMKVEKNGESIVTTRVSEIHLDDSPALCKLELTVESTPVREIQPSDLLPVLRFPVPVSPPSSFAVLEDLPPNNHYFIAENQSGSSQRIKRIRKEFEILKASLPPGIFVRTWDSRMDLLRVLILGPEGTPYEYAPFVFDMQFTAEFPNRPPSTFFHSWTTGQGPVNPNLYEDGLTCLSILGTWPTQNPSEAWSPEKSTVLQILVSIIGLVLVKAPFYNEAGYEALAVEDSRHADSSKYSEKTFLMARRFILHALKHPVAGLEDILTWHYLPDSSSVRPQLLRRAIHEARVLIEHSKCTSSGQGDGDPTLSTLFSRLSLGAVIILKRHVADLEKLESDIFSQQRL
ncbi:hypothetical protein BJX99DRAFT_1047 [Aspergillus californicus]